MLYLRKSKNRYVYDAFCIAVRCLVDIPNEMVDRIEKLQKRKKALKVTKKTKFWMPTSMDYLLEYDGFYVLLGNEGEILTDLDLLNKLKEVRATIAKRLDLPDLLVYKNRQLVCLATYKPLDKEDWKFVPGFQKRLLNDDDEKLLQTIKEHVKGLIE